MSLSLQTSLLHSFHSQNPFFKGILSFRREAVMKSQVCELSFLTRQHSSVFEGHAVILQVGCFKADKKAASFENKKLPASKEEAPF